MADDAVFTDVLSLSIDTDSFAADLQAVEEMWTAAVGRMTDTAQSAGIDPSQLIPTQGLSDQITELGAELQHLGETLQTSMADARAAVTQELGQIDAAVAQTKEKLASLADDDGGSGISRRQAKRSSLLGVDEDASLGENFVSGLTMGGRGPEGIAAMAGFLTSMQLMMAALQPIINGVVDAFMAIPNAIKQGIEYTEQFQQNVSDLQGALAANVTFSKDFVSNFQMAGEAAKYAEAQLQQSAVSANLDPKQLHNAFKSLTDSGAGAMVKDVGDLVTLATDFSLAMKAAGKSTDGTRALISELPKLIEGTEAPTSKILQTLGLTTEQWEKIRQEALQHKNLVALLAPELKPYQDALSAARANHEELVKQLDLIKDRIDSAFAAPVLAEFDDALQKILGWVKENRNAIELLGNIIGGSVADLMKFVGALAGLSSGKDILLSLASGAAIFDDTIATATGTVQNLIHAMKDLWNIHSDASHPFGTSQGWNSAIKDIKSFNAGTEWNVAENRKSLIQMVQTIKAQNAGTNWPTHLGEFMATATDAWSGGQNLPIRNARPPLPGKNINIASQLRREFEDQLALIKETYSKAEDEVKEAESQQTMTVAAGTQKRLALRKEELDGVQKMVDGFKAVYGSDPKAQAALDGMQKTLENLRTSSDKANTGDVDAAAREHQEILKGQYATEEKLAKDHAAAMSAIFKRAADEGLMSHHAAAQAEIEQQKELYAQKRQALLDQQKQFSPGTVGYTNLGNQISVLDDQQHYQRAQDSHALAAGDLKDARDEHSAKVASIEAEIAYAQTTKDLAGKQDDLDRLLAERLQADQEYLDAVRKNPTSTLSDKLSAASQVRQDKLGVVDQFNSSHWSQQTLNENGTVSNATPFQDFVQHISTVNQLFDTLQQTTNGLIEAFREGNAWKGAGAVFSGVGSAANSLSSIGDSLGALGGALPGIGAVAGIAGSLFSGIGSLFTQAAQQIAQNVQKAFQNILTEFNTQQINFTQAMQMLNQQENDAIQQLSGQKGGQAYLTQILDSINQTKAQMQFAAQQEMQNFQAQTVAMQQSTQAGQQWLQTWSNIENQVKAYLQQGGNTSFAASFQNAELQAQSVSLQQQYNQGLEQAIQDNYTLNSMYLSRQQIQLSILQLQQSTADSIERREAPALGLAAQETKLQLEQLQQQLSQTNNDITIQQNKVNAENQVFHLSTNINALHAADAAAQQQALTWQLDNYKQIYTIIQAIHGLQANPATGYFNGTPLFTGINGGVPGYGAVNPLGPGYNDGPPRSTPVIPITINLPNGGRYSIPDATVQRRINVPTYSPYA